jgi:hypothetical protein
MSVEEVITGISFVCIAGVFLYKGLYRYPTAHHIPPSFIFTKKKIKGKVTSVGDSDNFRLFHTPFLYFQPIPKSKN